jgi:hypothetical protein
MAKARMAFEGEEIRRWTALEVAVGRLITARGVGEAWLPPKKSALVPVPSTRLPSAQPARVRTRRKGQACEARHFSIRAGSRPAPGREGSAATPFPGEPSAGRRQRDALVKARTGIDVIDVRPCFRSSALEACPQKNRVIVAAGT